jgi:hypothetical protein
MADSQNFNPAREITSLRFDEILGAPLRAIVDAQYYAAKRTLQFIEEELMEDGRRVRNVTFRFDRHVERDGVTETQDTEVSIPLLTIMPIPYMRLDWVNIKFSVKLESMRKSEDSTDRTDDKKDTTSNRTEYGDERGEGTPPAKKAETPPPPQPVKKEGEKKEGEKEAEKEAEKEPEKKEKGGPQAVKPAPQPGAKPPDPKPAPSGPWSSHTDKKTKTVTMEGHVTTTTKRKNEREDKKTYSLDVTIQAVREALPPGMDRLVSLLENSIRERAVSK